ncbi:MAG: 50S ribosomal protein L23 [Chloroflexota bacterium]|nr:MAG: 50S ribosomal protein L23 [Chloroflexota bacterium]
MALHLYDVIRRPLITEKSNILADELNQYVFEVAPEANKAQIKEAIEVIFDKKVKKVNTVIMPAKRGRRGRKTYVRSKQYKKAIVTLVEGDKIELFNV